MSGVAYPRIKTGKGLTESFVRCQVVTFGSRTYPVEYSYNYNGRIKTMTTDKL